MASRSDQLTLSLQPPRARRTDPATSKAAAASMVEGASAQARLVLTALRAIGQGNYTDIASMASMEPVQVNRRLSELRAAGLVRRLDATTRTPSGRLAHLYEATLEGDGDA